MKIVNGSPTLADKGSISVSLSEIYIGMCPKAEVFTGVLLISWIIGVVGPGKPGSIFFYLLAGLGVGVFCWRETPDNRLKYTADQIEKLVVGSIDRVGTKNAGGSLGGAAVGGILFGGAGAIVGAVAGGNNVAEFTNVTIKFTDGEWAVLASEKGFADDLEYKNLIKLAGYKNICPI